MSNRGNIPDRKIQAKPPSGRRHSTTGNYQYNDQDKKVILMKTLENMPPRFQKKYMEDNGLTPDDVSGWDGSSSVYQVKSFIYFIC